MRHRRDRIDVAGGRGRAAVGASARCSTTLGFDDFVDPAESSAAADGAARARRACRRRCTATRWSRSTSWTRSARDGVAKELVGARHRRRERGATCLDVRSTACRRSPAETLGRARQACSARPMTRSRTCATSSRWPTARRPRARIRVDPEPRARAVILHGRDHGDRRARSGRQPRRRRPLRQPRRHVPRPRRAGLRLLARPRADHRRDDRARDVSRTRSPAAAST